MLENIDMPKPGKKRYSGDSPAFKKAKEVFDELKLGSKKEIDSTDQEESYYSSILVNLKRIIKYENSEKKFKSLRKENLIIIIRVS